MQIQSENYALFSSLVNQAKNILILAGKTPDVDNLAAAISLERSLSASKKAVQIIFKGTIPSAFENYVQIIKPKIENKKLIISFNWQKNAVDKVSYKLEGEDFNFIVTPKNKKINSDEVKIAYSGMEPDLVIALGISSLADLEPNEKDYLENTTIVNIDKNPNNQLYGRLNFIKEETDGICSVVAFLWEKSQLTISGESADLLLFGLRQITDNFNKVVDPDTFKAAAFCTQAKRELKEKSPEFDKEPSVPKDWLSPKVFRSKHQVS